MNALLTDLYQLTMAAGYWQAGKCDEVATFELFVRRLPFNRNFMVVAGLAQGWAGGLLALFLAEALRRAAVTYAGARTGDLTDLLVGRPLPLPPSVLIVATGALLGAVSAWFAVREARDVVR